MIPLWWRPKAATFVLALNKAHVPALNTAHVLRPNKADVLVLNKAHVLRLSNKICPVLRANTKEAAFGRLHKGGGLRPPPFVASFALALNKAHVLALNTAHVLRLNKADVLALSKAHV